MYAKTKAKPNESDTELHQKNNAQRSFFFLFLDIGSPT